jgi:RHS repeat-associated protein
MKIKSLLQVVLVLVLISNVSKAQIKPNSSDQGSRVSSLPKKSYFSSDKVSYVRTYDFFKAMSSESGLSTEISNGNVMQTTQYVDGLGRPIETVARRALPGGYDLVEFMVYDEYGRQVYHPMSFKSRHKDGRMHLSPSDSMESFMNSHYPDEDIFYGKSEYENSPLNRVTKQMAPGNSWAGSEVGVSSTWRSNNTDDAVRIWTAGTSSASSPGTYSNNSLTVTITSDENGNQVREFTDKLGRIVLKRVQKGTSTADGRNNWLNTYYVYDDYGDLRFVLPPRAEEVLKSANWSWNSTDMNALAFHYTYDGRNRMITKRVPGGGLVEMVYDKLDRLVLTRDANLSGQGKWMFTKYDALNRAVLSGFINSSNPRSQMQAYCDASGVLNVSTEPLNTSNVLEANSITLSHHVSGTVKYKSKTTIEFLPGFDSNGEYFETEIAPALSSDYTYVMGYHDATFPNLKDYTEEILTVNYFDNYDFTVDDYDSGQEVNFYSVGTHNAINPTVYTNAKGLPTGSRVKVLGSADSWLSTVMFYDDRGRVIQTLSDNHLGGKDISTTQYDFSGKVLNTYFVHNNPEASGSDAQTKISKRYIYESSGTGRLLSVKQKIGTGSYKVIATNTYDALGQLESKKLNSASSPLETLNYDYTVRGWLKGINTAYAKNGTGSHYFGMDLSYDYGFTQNQLNGNIAGVKWRTASSDQTKAYGFDYDESNRLKEADFTQGSSWLQTTNDFSTTYSYDVNGNITNLTRKGVVAGSIQTIDNLTYAYLNSGRSNQLKKVADAAGDLGQGDFVDGHTGSTDYAYDANGNMIQDLNKDIQSGDITYNHLNLPETVTFSNNSAKTITYAYDAAGIKLSKTVNNGGYITTTDYVSGFIYENNQLQHFGHDEGRVRKNYQGNLVYDYYIKDHLGNTRMTLTEDQDVTEYRATMETSQEEVEEQLFLNMDASRISYSAANMTGGGDKVSRLNGGVSTRTVGPGKILAVTPGDEVDMEVYAYYSGSPGSTTPNSQGTMLTAVAAAFGGSAGASLGTESRSIYELFNANAAATLVGSDATHTNEPRAYLNYMFFDKDFNLVNAKTGFKQISSAAGDDAIPELLSKSLTIDEGGYLYVYISNETAASFEVYFDELEITHNKGAILQEDHYYPFGANISALSSSAPLSKPNRYKLSGNEEQTEFDFNVYDFNARTYDPILGRFMQVDPMADKRTWVNPYNYVQNNPMIRLDPEGTEDWYLNENGDLAYNENVKSQADLDAAGIKGTYQGEEGFGIDENNGNLIHYTSTGHTTEGALWAGEVTVTANPVEMAVLNAGHNFTVGALALTSDILNQASNTTTAAALVIAPFAPPVAGALYEIGNGLDIASTGFSWASKGLDGTLTKSEVLTDVAFLGSNIVGGKLIDKAVDNLQIVGGGKQVLDGVFDNSLNITKELVVPAFQRTLQKKD